MRKIKKNLPIVPTNAFKSCHSSFRVKRAQTFSTFQENNIKRIYPAKDTTNLPTFEQGPQATYEIFPFIDHERVLRSK